MAASPYAGSVHHAAIKSTLTAFGAGTGTPASRRPSR